MNRNKPNLKPENPNFSSGPTAKRPGWSIINLQSSLVSRSHRSIECKKKLKEVNEEEKVKGPSTVNNALFVGSTSELSKLLKAQTKKEDK